MRADAKPQMSWWQRFTSSDTGFDESRWLVLDVETSGLDARKDRLLAIAAVALRVDWSERTLAIDLPDSFELVVRQSDVSSHDNILLHGIGTERQRAGVPAPDALQAFVQYAGQSPLLAFHAAFDETMIGRYAHTHLGQVLPNPWADIEALCAVTHEEVRARALDDWLAHFGIACRHRHQAASDALAEAELLLRIWPAVARHCHDWASVRALAAQSRWIRRRG
jgi:DNA polymerase III subunit epsilon